MRLFAIRKAVKVKAVIRASARSLPWPVLFTMVAADSAYGVQESRLWLPRAQHELRPLILQAAQLAENADGCQEVISGELDTERSMDSEPVFRIVCRNPAGYTYSVFVTDAGKPNARVEKVQSADGANAGTSASAAGESTRPMPIDDKTASQKCLAALKLRTDRMADVVLRESDLQRLQSPAGTLQYELDFDAADPSGLALRFHAICRVSAGGTALIEIKPRRADSPPRKPDAPEPATPTALTPTAPQPAAPEPATPEPATPKQTDDDGWEVIE